MNQLIWTAIAKESYIQIVNFILQKWPVDIVLKLDAEIETLLDKLKANKHLCPVSIMEPATRKCVINKHTSMLYEVQENSVVILLFLDNRSDHGNLNL